jgi:hypothetical protein
MVTSIIVAVAVAGVFDGIRSMAKTEVKANTADLLQRLAVEKVNDLEILSDPSVGGDNGDFSDRGYPDIMWTADVETASITNVDELTVTVSQGTDSQTITTMVYVPQESSTTGTTTTTTTTPGGGGGAGAAR